MSADLVLFDCDDVLVDSEVLQVAVEARVLTELGWPIEAEEVVRRWMGRTAHEQLAEIGARLGADGVRRTAGLAWCVASSGSRERIDRTLGLTGLRRRFEGRVFSALEVEHGKPAPDLFLHAASQMGVDPTGCVVVEDSPYGVRAGVAAGMRVLGYGSGLAGAQALADAGAEVFDHMSRVPRLLGL